jgi:flagellar assembly factor FliW
MLLYRAKNEGASFPMPTMQQFPSTRFGTLDVDEAAIIDFPTGLIGLPGRRWVLVPAGEESPFQWLHSLEAADLALPVTSPWAFFADFSVELSDADSARVGSGDPDAVEVLVTVRAGAQPSDFSANLRAPILIFDGRGHQLINEADDAPVRASLGLERLAGRAA